MHHADGSGHMARVPGDKLLVWLGVAGRLSLGPFPLAASFHSAGSSWCPGLQDEDDSGVMSSSPLQDEDGEGSDIKVSDSGHVNDGVPLTQGEASGSQRGGSVPEAHDHEAPGSSYSNSNRSSNSSRNVPPPRLHRHRSWAISMGEAGTVLGLPSCTAPSDEVRVLLEGVLARAEQEAAAVTGRLAQAEHEAEAVAGGGTASAVAQLDGRFLWKQPQMKGAPLLSRPAPPPSAAANPLGLDAVRLLLGARGADYEAVCAAADRVR